MIKNRCDLCGGHADDTSMRPYSCKYCRFVGGGLGIDSRAGSEATANRIINQVHTQNCNTHTNFTLSAPGTNKEGFGNRVQPRVHVFYNGPLFGFLILPGYDRESKFVTRKYVNCYAAEFKPEFVVREDKLAIKLHGDDPIDSNSAWFNGTHTGSYELGVILK